eukprot:m.98246 g.98246  ORF g.98246 m.98246 type:complete len:1081 (+) comp27046_c0_seq1:117-3359(+)
MENIHSQVETLLRKEFAAELDSDDTTPFRSHESYWRLIELKFTLRSLRTAVHRNYEATILLGHSRGVIHTTPIENVKAQCDEIDTLLAKVEKSEKEKLERTIEGKLPLPRPVRLAQIYNLLPSGLEVFQLLVLGFTAKTESYRSQASAYTEVKDLVSSMCVISALDLENLYLDENKFVADGVLLVDTSYENEKSPRITREVATALYGHELGMKDRLKLAGTEVLKLVNEDGEGDDTMNVGEDDEAKKVVEVKKVAAVQGDDVDDDDDDTAFEADVKQAEPNRLTSDHFILAELDELMAQETAALSKSPAKKKARRVSDSVLALSADGKYDKPYDSALDFLDDYFHQVTEQIKLSRERLKRDMKDVVGDDDTQPWEREKRGTRTNMREFEAKLRMVKNRIEHRLNLTSKAGLPMPRLQMLCSRLELDEFEKMVMVILIGHTVSPMMKEILDSLAQKGGLSERFSITDSVSVKLLLHTLCNTFQEQVSSRVYFYKSSKLLARGIIKMPSTRQMDVDLMQQTVVLDRRILDWVVGLDTEISEVVEGSNLYVPKVLLEDVVLEQSQKDAILTAVTSFQAFKVYQKRQSAIQASHFSESFARGLVLLFSGPSGTGKTMTANALAAHLKMKVLLVNFNSMVEAQSSKRGSSLQSLFREADIHNAVLFFDECESLFAQRGRGGSAQLTELLTEIERHHGIIFLATNRPYDLDEAMHRRITSSFEFRPPNHIEREKIWQIHTSSAGVPLAGKVDFHDIAIRYELAGGYIKNAVLSALLLAIAREGSDNPKVNQADIIAGCALQMRGTLKMKSFSDRVVPTFSMDSLVFPQKTEQELSAVVDLEKARRILFGQWGFGDSMRAQQSTAVLFTGPNGCGKRSAAEAIGYETGRPLKVMNYARLMASMSRSSSHAEESVIKSVFKDAALMNAIVVLEGFEVELFQETRSADYLHMSELLHEIERYNGAVILTVSTPKKLEMFVHRMDPVFVRRFKFLIQFNMPNATIREELWKRLIPEKVPKEPKLDYSDLSQKFVLSAGQISKVAYRAAAFAALRPVETRFLTMKDLKHAASIEENKGKGEVSAMVQQWFA